MLILASDTGVFLVHTKHVQGAWVFHYLIGYVYNCVEVFFLCWEGEGLEEGEGYPYNTFHFLIPYFIFYFTLSIILHPLIVQT